MNHPMKLNLHSTMYLLKPDSLGETATAVTLFTFHYVSIKTAQAGAQRIEWFDLHSTMYLLKRV